MAPRISSVLAYAVGSVGLLVACSGGSKPSVTIQTPAESDTVRGSAVHVTLGVSGIALAPAADERPNTAHHHLFLDAETGPLDQKIPAGVTGIIHLGRAQTEFHWDSVASGSHRIIAVLADWSHLPLVPLATDTVQFVVVQSR